MNTNKLKFGEKISYGFGDCGATVATTLIATYLTAYYTDTVGIAIGAIGTMMLLARILDGFSDIIMGIIVDNTRSKWGKARPWLLWSAPFMALSIILLFNVPMSFSDNGKLIYVYITYFFQSAIVYTANNLPYNTLLARLTLNVQDRASATSIRMVMTTIVTLIINAVTVSMLTTLGWKNLSILYGIVSLVFFIISFLGVKEHVGMDEGKTVKQEKIPLKIAVKALIKNKFFFMQALMFILQFIYAVSIGSVTFYFAKDILGNIGAIATITLASTVPTLLINMVAPKFIAKLGKRKFLILGCVLLAIGSILVGAAGNNLTLVLIGTAVRALGTGPCLICVFAMTADVVDYGEWKTGIRSEGLISSCTSFGMKVGIGLGGVVGTTILSIGGYNGMAEMQSESALSAIRFAYGYNGAILAGACIILALVMNLDKYMGDIQRDLEQKEGK